MKIFLKSAIWENITPFDKILHHISSCSWKRNITFALAYLFTTPLEKLNMMQYLEEYHLSGLAIGICTFLIIGLFHPLVIKGEYYFGTRCCRWFLIAGFLGIGSSLWISNIFWSSLLGVIAFSCFWSIHEVKEQQERVRKGWYPRNPKRIYPWDHDMQQ